MNPTNLAYFLNGFLEMTPTGQGMTAEQVDTLRRHVALVLTNVTDDMTIGPDVYVGGPDDVTCWSEEETEGHDVGYVPTEEEMDGAMKYAFRTLSKNHPESAYNGTLPIQTCLTC